MDAEYWIRAGAAGLRLRHLPAKLGKFRLMAGTKSLSSPTVFWEDYLEIFRRYRGAGRLARFFGYYYYNLARLAGGDLPRAVRDGERVFERWRGLPKPEQAALSRDARRGLALAQILLIRDGQRGGTQPRPGAALRAAMAADPPLALRPLTLGILIRSRLGRTRAAALDRCIDQAIHRYRTWRFDYRYVRGR
jgi:hypothetical protein